MIRVIIPGEYRFHNLPDRTDRRVAGIIVDIFQPQVFCLLVALRQKFQIQIVLAQCRDQQVKMDRGHIGDQDRVSFSPCFFRKKHTVMRAGLEVSVDTMFLAKADSCDQGTDPDPGCSQVIDLIDLQYGVEPA